MSVSAAWPSQVTGDRAAIVEFADAAINADWLDEAAQAIAGRADPCRIQDRLADGDRGWWILADGEAVGALCGRVARSQDDPGDLALVWTWLAVNARWRAFGYGGASVPLLEEAARSVGANLALAPLPSDNGVALYFWLRLGYTPVRTVGIDPTNWPAGVPADALWMQRDLRPTSESMT